MDFSTMKNNRKSFLKDLRGKVKEQIEPKNDYHDDRFWKLSVDSSQNGQATIRFLPTPKGEELPYVQYYSHSFKNSANNLFYIENCLSSIGQDDPVNELNNAHWETYSDEEKQRKRKVNYVANVYIVEDKANPENEGKVFLYRFGKSIFDLIQSAMFPEDEDEDPINVFDFWEGANFKLKAREKAGWRNYDLSKFMKVEPLFEDDEELEKVWNQQHKLFPFIDPENDDMYKSYDQLVKKLIRVVPEAAEVFGEVAPNKNAVENKQTAEAPAQKSEPRKEDPEEDLDLDSLDDIEELGWDDDSDDDIESFEDLM